MISISRTKSLDEMVRPETLQGYTFSAEDRGHKFIISCTRQGEPYALSGSITARFKRANNTTVLLGGAIESGAATVVLSGDCYNVPGGFRLTIYNTVDGVTTCIYSGEGTVIYASNGELIDSGDIVPSLDDVVEEMEAVRAATDAANNAAALASSTAVAFGPYTAFDILASADKSTKINNGVTYTWDGNKMIVDGTIDPGATYSMVAIYNKSNELPFGVRPGMTLRMINDITPCWLGINFYVNGAWGTNITYVRRITTIGIVPENATGMRIYEGVSDAYMESENYGHAEVNPVIMDSAMLTNSELNNRIVKTFEFHGALPHSETPYDLNDLADEGMYVLPLEETYTNVPSGVSFGGAAFLFVYPVVRTYGITYTGVLMQKLSVPRLGDWVRIRSNNVWGAWRRTTLPDRPARDGAYGLRCTVTNGVPTYSWKAI